MIQNDEIQDIRPRDRLNATLISGIQKNDLEGPSSIRRQDSSNFIQYRNKNMNEKMHYNSLYQQIKRKQSKNVSYEVSQMSSARLTGIDGLIEHVDQNLENKKGKNLADGLLEINKADIHP